MKIKAGFVWILIAICVALAAMLVARFVLGGAEDSWICSEGAWVMHGHPSSPKPTSLCP